MKLIFSKAFVFFPINAGGDKYEIIRMMLKVIQNFSQLLVMLTGLITIDPINLILLKVFKKYIFFGTIRIVSTKLISKQSKTKK